MDFIVDFETMSSLPNAMVVDMSIVLFDPNPEKMETFEQLIQKGRRWKISIPSQKGVRHVMPETVTWWKEQSAEARANLKPSENDVTIEQATTEALQWLKANGVNNFRSQGWSRGTGFDFMIFTDIIRQTLQKDFTQFDEPVMFWAQRDIRTAIEAYMMVRGMALTPLKKGSLDGFVAHDSIHDCAKDVFMLKMAQRYVLGLDQIPKSDDIDPSSIKPKHLEQMKKLESQS